MYCEFCGYKLAENMNFCENCGRSVNEIKNQGESLKEKTSSFVQNINWKKLDSMGRMVLSIGGIGIIILVCLSFFGFADNEYVKIVKNGSLNSYPNVKIGKAFNQYFSEPTWDYFLSSDDEHVVEFTGECLFLDEETEVYMQFIVDPEGTFSIDYLSLDDITQGYYMLSGLLEAVMEDYTSK